MTDVSLSRANPTGKPLAAVLALICGLGLFVLCVTFAAGRMMTEAVTSDLPWILAAGHDMIAERRIPSEDLFSWTYPDAPWVLYQWLFEVFVAAGEAWVGLEVLVQILLLLMAVIYVFGPAIHAVSCRVPLFLALLPACAALAVSTVNLSLRPMLATTLFLLVQYVAVDRLSRGRGSLALSAVAIAFVYVLWGNMHIGLAVGLLSLVLCLLGDLLQRCNAYGFDPADPAVEGQPLAPGAYLLLLAVAVAASLCNPYGPDLYFYILESSAKGGLKATINELQSPNFHALRPGIFLVMAAVFFASLLRGTRVYAGKEILHLLVFTFCTFMAGRFIVWAVLFYALIMPKALYQLWMTSAERHGLVLDMTDFFERHRRRLLVVMAGLGLLIIAVVPHWLQPFTLGRCTQVLPGIEAYQELKNPGERLFTDSVIGSCLLLVEPQGGVFIDTRFDFYPEDFVVDVAAALAVRGDWRAFLERWDTPTLIIEKAAPLASVLQELPDYDVLYEDDYVILFRRSPDWTRSTTANGSHDIMNKF